MPAELAPSVDRALQLLPPWADGALQRFRVDFAAQHRQPSTMRVLAATAVALAGSLLADAILVKAGETVLPGTKGYVHFRFADYAKLTIIGVIIACVAWPIVTRISSDPRWLFFRQAIAVTLVLFLPDLYLLYKGSSGEAVAVLIVMHVAIALVTYNALVHIAKVWPAVTSRRPGAHAAGRARRGTDEDYVREDYVPEDRYLEPARRYPRYHEPDGRYGPRYHEPDDDPYEAYFRKPADPYQDRMR